MREDFVEQFLKIGFSKMEAQIYMTVLEEGEMTGYQIAKFLNISRASVYPVAESLVKKGVLELLPGDTNRYRAEAPDTVIERTSLSFNNAATELKEKLPKLKEKNGEERYINLSGFDNVVSKCKEVFAATEKELYINTDFELELFKDEFKLLKKRGVKIILFTFADIVKNSIPIEYYHYKTPDATCRNKRIMAVSDMKKALIAGEERESSYIGTVTENKLFARIIAEHIHHDIYLLKLKNKNGKNLIESDILINSMLENRNNCEIFTCKEE